MATRTHLSVTSYAHCPVFEMHAESNQPRWRTWFLTSLLVGALSTVGLRDLKLPMRLNPILPSSGLLRGVRFFDTDVSGLLWTDTQSRNVNNKPPYAAWQPRRRKNYAALGCLIPTFRDYSEPIGSPETSIPNHLMLPNNPEGGWHYHGGGHS
jgi:hypothetical protein